MLATPECLEATRRAWRPIRWIVVQRERAAWERTLKRRNWKGLTDPHQLERVWEWCDGVPDVEKITIDYGELVGETDRVVRGMAEQLDLVVTEQMIARAVGSIRR